MDGLANGRLRRLLVGGVRRQLVVGIALVHAVLMTVFVVDLVTRQHGFLRGESVHQASSLARTVAVSSSSWVLADDLRGLAEVVGSVSEFRGLSYAMIVDPFGRVLGHTDDAKVGLFLVDPVSRDMLLGPEETRTLVVSERLVDVAVPIRSGTETIGWARVGIGQNAQIAALRQVTRDGIAYTLIAIAAGTIFAIWMARQLTARLTRLIHFSNAVKQGRRIMAGPPPQMDEIGLLEQAFTTMADTIWRREEDLRKLTRAVEQSPVGVMITDIDGQVEYINPAFEACSGFPAGEIIGMRCQVVCEMAGETVQYREIQSHRRDGSPYWEAVSVSPIRRPDGAVTHYLAVRENVTERRLTQAHLKQSMERLVASNADLERFAYVASHDLQEPLRSVAQYCQLLQRRYRGRLDADADDFIGFIVDGSTHMIEMVRGLLEFSRIESRGKELGPVDTGKALEAALTQLRGAIENGGAEIVRGDLPTVAGDALQVIQLFQNLVGNALKFRHRERAPRVVVTAERAGDWWEFRVRDNGIGIDPAYVDQLFVMFRRLVDVHEYPGTGIGLAICRRIVERHGGTIRVEPEPEGGCCFVFTLPALDAGYTGERNV